ncbi:MAG: AIR synthase family protein [Ferroplasma sp.]|uniref:AIR synthase family protein n=1 Tax=Ferroplasma sp. TaxID=2591003 RepID=UPI0028153BEC|nr:AIR synthase family protein [Ferroplasma sp.]WMT52128.1 MAG: AIR synthase family protein [Ferroplasma sp.]
MIGKISRKFFEDNIINRIGAVRKDVAVPPRNGVDVGIIAINGSYMAVTTDPLYIDRSFGFKKAAWFAFHILASDLFTSGIKASYMSIDLNLPQEITDEQFNEIWNVIHGECEKYGIEVVTGHTARYAGVSFPMVGGVTLMGVGDRYITTENASPGDVIIMARSCGLEASIILAYTFPEYIKESLGSNTLNAIKDKFYTMTCVPEELMAIDYGIGERITSMHDATEGGLLNSVYEIGYASGNGVMVNYNSIIIDSDIAAVCSLFNINPLRSISEGTLLLTVKREYGNEFTEMLKKSGINASIIGEVTDKTGGMKLIKDGKESVINPEDDQLWGAVSGGVKRGLK